MKTGMSSEYDTRKQGGTGRGRRKEGRERIRTGWKKG